MSRFFKIALSVLVLTSSAVQAEEKPLWEAGIGVAALSFPSYRGSDQTNNFLMPVPMFSYHGDFFKADRHGSSPAKSLFSNKARIDGPGIPARILNGR